MGLFLFNSTHPPSHFFLLCILEGKQAASLPRVFILNVKNLFARHKEVPLMGTSDTTITQ